MNEELDSALDRILKLHQLRQVQGFNGLNETSTKALEAAMSYATKRFVTAALGTSVNSSGAEPTEGNAAASE